MTRASILLVDDEEGILKTLGRALREEGHEVLAVSRAREAERLLAARSFDLLVVDNRMPERSGLELIRDLAASTTEGERPSIVMMTAHATVESAIEAMKLGAFDYLQKPFEVDELLVVARRALEHQRLRTQHSYLLSERDEEFNHYGIVGRSRAIQDLIRKLELVAQSKSTVLVTGETGTGKELAARAIHDRSAQRDMPLIKVNCAAIPETLLESELFGHVKGAFTGAVSSKKGKFALADGGTIFLDEIGMMSPALQAKLLRVLQDGMIRRVGDTKTQKVDVRVYVSPTRSNARSCSTRRSLICRSEDAVPISSRKIVPPSAASNLPGLSRTAPVNAPRAWPKSSLSSRLSGSAPQLTSTNGPVRRLERWWNVRAISVLPVPLSPSIRIVARVSATASIDCRILCTFSSRESTLPSSKRSSRRSLSTLFSSRSARCSSARATATSTCSSVQGLHK